MTPASTELTLSVPREDLKDRCRPSDYPPYPEPQRYSAIGPTKVLTKLTIDPVTHAPIVVAVPDYDAPARAGESVR